MVYALIAIVAVCFFGAIITSMVLEHKKEIATLEARTKVDIAREQNRTASNVTHLGKRPE